MTPAIEHKLIKRFPMIFADVYADMTRTNMCWGIACGDGWYDILYVTCLGIEEEYNKIYPWYKKLYHRAAYYFIPRWNRLIDKQPEWMMKTKYWGPSGEEKNPYKVKRFYLHMPSWAKASQVKEKYGTLRFYLTFGTDKMHDYTDLAEKMSETTCESCGKYGELRGKWWLYTSCEEHAKEEDKKILENLEGNE